MGRRMERRGSVELRHDEQIRVTLFGALSGDGCEECDELKFVPAGAAPLRVEVRSTWQYVDAAAALLREVHC